MAASPLLGKRLTCSLRVAGFLMTPLLMISNILVAEWLSEHIAGKACRQSVSPCPS